MANSAISLRCRHTVLYSFVLGRLTMVENGFVIRSVAISTITRHSYRLTVVRRAADSSPTFRPERIPRDSIVLSFGLAQQVTFEAGLQEITRNCCSIFGYDIRGDRRKVKFLYSQIPRTNLRKAYVGSFNWKDTYTVDTLLNLDNITAVEIMKMDIESNEYKVLPQFLIMCRPAQIMLEIHGISMQTAELLQRISLHGYWLISYEINGEYHDSCEYSFIHESAFDKYHVIPLAKYLD
ncbi:unnamed protein product [Cylicocyclus nassatus]|uniref:Methyltransferase FkbM domain-containing protein n=1 Tax=Cylicocyclus nassatus TaxID=53992 RepID=A0AA36DSK5_CYLNA|nr:unnamed protein product [Cylicocyclus nassatus]